jgi:saccharopine dehydrogenase (NAD+, L-lysine-forming)
MFTKVSRTRDSGPRTAGVLGAAGTQADAFLQALARTGGDLRLVAVDRRWDPAARSRVERLGCTVVSADIQHPAPEVHDRLKDAQVIASFVGPFDAIGTAALELAIDTGADYLDICDDLRATGALLAMDAPARSAGIAAIVGMGSTPGMSTVLVRLGLDALGPESAPPQVDIRWVAEGAEMTPAILEHVIHCFMAVMAADGRTTWRDLEPEKLDFPEPIGVQEVVTLGHPEVMTIPRFFDVEKVTNKGGSTPSAYMHVAWSAAQAVSRGTGIEDVQAAFATARGALNQIVPTGGSGLIVDVRADGDGYRFASGSLSTSVADATGVPPAAGVLALLEGEHPGPGVWAPECLAPAVVLKHLARVSRGGGAMKAYRLEAGTASTSLRLRDLLATTAGRERRLV